MAPRPRTTSRRRTLLAFAPALVIGLTTAFVASGASLVPGASATNVDISGSVNGSVSTDATLTGCGDTALDTFEAGFDVTSTCTVSFASNYSTGSEVQYSDGYSGAAFFCSDGVVGAGGTRDCTVAGNRVENVAANAAITADTVGIGLTAVGGTQTPTFGSGVEAAQAPAAGTAMWYPITTAARELCYIAVPNTDSNCTFVVGAQGGAAQGAGDYTGRIALTTVVN